MNIWGINRAGRFTVVLFLLVVTGCTGMPDDVKPVGQFEINRYLGKWYEIARLDHSFERGMDNVTAEYTMMSDGGVSVRNRGYLAEDNQWKTAEGKAYFVDRQDLGYLKVSFFGPFYGSYVIFELDSENYQYAFVTSYDKSYLWLLSRTPLVSDDLVKRFVELAGELGYPTDALVYVDHHGQGTTLGVE
ncbi:MAG: lipocalin family protein [Gammaproteobacteria bacterium]|nr:lipocalin family protein [Gammaproteobacteria bacterium]